MHPAKPPKHAENPLDDDWIIIIKWEKKKKKSYRILFFSFLEHKNKKSGKMSGTEQINYFFETWNNTKHTRTH